MLQCTEASFMHARHSRPNSNQAVPYLSTRLLHFAQMNRVKNFSVWYAPDLDTACSATLDPHGLAANTYNQALMHDMQYQKTGPQRGRAMLLQGGTRSCRPTVSLDASRGYPAIVR